MDELWTLGVPMPRSPPLCPLPPPPAVATAAAAAAAAAEERLRCTFFAARGLFMARRCTKRSFFRSDSFSFSHLLERVRFNGAGPDPCGGGSWGGTPKNQPLPRRGSAGSCRLPPLGCVPKGLPPTRDTLEAAM
jgi:hypothetical protein